MLIGLPTMKPTYLLITGFLVQPVFSSGKGRGTALWIDFDGTIATNEAFETLALAAYDSMKVEEAAQYPPWSYYGDIYNTEYEAFSNKFGPRDNLSAEIAYHTSPLLHQVESDSFDRVAEAGIFHHIKFSALQEAAAAVVIRDGFWKMVATSQSYGITPQIASLNWSVRWIRLVLEEDLKRRREVATKEERKWLKDNLAEKVAIYCSEILPKGIVKASRLDFPTRLHTGWDKVQLVRNLTDKTGKEAGRVLFFGDSTNDLPPLMLEPTTVGIVTGRDSGMNRTLAKFGIGVVELDPIMERAPNTIDKGFLYHTDRFLPWGTN